MPIPQEKKFCGTGILPVLIIFARGLLSIALSCGVFKPLTIQVRCVS
ncbi:hypothetical protein QUB70_02610 [Microcoleus sp. A003_D6]